MSPETEDGTADAPRDPMAAAVAIAEEVLFPDAGAIDRAPVVPARYLDALAGAGLYGLYGPADAGGLDADERTGARVVEAIGGASLAAAFIWIQHHAVVRAVGLSRPEIRDRWLQPLCAGRIRAGVASAVLRRAGPPAVTAEPVRHGWILDGTVPWVTGWERIGVVYVAARADDRIVWALVDAVATSTVTPQPLDLAAVRSTSTVQVELSRHPVPDGRVLHIEAFADWQRRDASGLRSNGYLAIGVAARCAGLLGSSELAAAVAQARDRLDHAGGTDVAAARADASLLAVRAATALVVVGGGGSIDLRSDAQRLAREAMFLLVFGQTADIRAAQLARLVDPSLRPRS